MVLFNFVAIHIIKSREDTARLNQNENQDKQSLKNLINMRGHGDLLGLPHIPLESLGTSVSSVLEF